MTEELVVLARGGDHAAFERLAAESIDRLYAIACRVLLDPAAAEGRRDGIDSIQFLP